MRPRTKSKETTKLSIAVRQLRRACGQTQREFAATLGVTPVTVARWETTRQPGGQVLVKLKNLASERGLGELEDVFFSAGLNEFAGYRLGLSTTLQHEAMQCIEMAIQMATDASIPPQFAPKVQAMLEVLQDIWDHAGLLNPIHASLVSAAEPETTPEA
ncbi:MAG: helix-turn-helix transcriptional regulator [Planctomycetota bacterium]